MNRKSALQKIETTDLWDIIIIGGGATGLGVAVDSATRGLKTLLLEAHDFAKGTSSRSTKLVHGGVRYLEQGDIPLVLEALRERGLLHKNAPHLVHHLSFIVPRYKWWEGPFFGIGLKVYDALAGKLNLAKSRILPLEETLKAIPNIEQNGLQGGVEYFDGQFDDARLAITLAQSAVDHEATLLNYAEVTELTKTNGMVDGLTFKDVESGTSHKLRSKVIINATGIFTDSIRHMDDADAAPAVQPSQGVHLVFDRSFLPGDSAIMVPHTDDGRVLFVIPWHDRVLVGTTDTAMDHADLEPRALDEEVGFILRNASRYLARDPERKDILSVFAGQRPLVRPPSKDGSATKSISRNHEVFVSDSGLVTIVGGKWTTYRKMAEDTLNHAIQIGGLDDKPCVTEHLQLHGWRSPNAPNLSPELAAYGTDADEVEALAAENPDLKNPLHPDLTITAANVLWAVRNEMALTLEDVLARRTRCLLLNALASIEVAPDVAALMAKELAKDAAWEKEELARFTQLAKGYTFNSVK
ncbi:MAG: glycerol-3-phosphate dehydrogenase/oxidase [Chthoniobacterales bacterium]